MEVYNIIVQETEYMKLELIPKNIIVFAEKELDIEQLTSIEQVVQVSKISGRIALKIPKVSTVFIGKDAEKYKELLELYCKAYTCCK